MRALDEWLGNQLNMGAEMLFGHLALISAAVFSGAALYVSVAEQPARLKLDDQALLAEWKPSYKRGFAMQAPLALIGCIFGLLAWWRESEFGLLIGAALMIAPWPWTLIAIMPTNNALMAIDPAKPTPNARALVVKWGYLHAVRSALGVLATLSFLWGCLSN